MVMNMEFLIFGKSWISGNSGRTAQHVRIRGKKSMITMMVIMMIMICIIIIITIIIIVIIITKSEGSIAGREIGQKRRGRNHFVRLSLAQGLLSQSGVIHQ